MPGFLVAMTFAEEAPLMLRPPTFCSREKNCFSVPCKTCPDSGFFVLVVYTQLRVPDTEKIDGYQKEVS
jgi:hypothetical protein